MSKKKDQPTAAALQLHPGTKIFPPSLNTALLVMVAYNTCLIRKAMVDSHSEAAIAASDSLKKVFSTLFAGENQDEQSHKE